MMAVENMSQGVMQVAHSDLESIGGTGYNMRKQAVVANQDQYIPGTRAISMRTEQKPGPQSQN